MPGVVRAFLIALAISLGTPLVLIAVGSAARLLAMWLAYVVSPRLVYAYPAYLFVPGGEQDPALLLSIAQMCALSALFAFIVRAKMADRQFAWGVAGFVGWWGACRLVFGWQIIPPNVGTHI